MRIVIIGGDAAGMSAASQVRRRRPDWEVVVLEKSPFTSYASCGIPYFLAGDVADLDELVVVTPEEFRRQRGIDVRTGWEAVALDPDSHTVIATHNGDEVTHLTYDRLLLATGASPIVPDWSGAQLAGVTAVRSLGDAQRLQQQLDAGVRRAVVVGAGYVGLELAEALRRRGVEVTVVEKLPGVMGGAAPQVTELTAAELERQGVKLLLETTVLGFAAEQGRLAGVETDHGTLPAELAVVALGVRPNVELARAAGVPLGESGAIAVDERQRTGAADVWAAGDCAEAFHRVLGRAAWVPLALTANRQGRVAGTNLADGDETFPGIVGSAVTRVFDLVLARTGIDQATAQRAGIPWRSATATAPSKAHYFPGHEPLWVELLYRPDDLTLLGCWIVGHDMSAGKRCDVVATAISAGMTVVDLAGLDLTYAPPFAPVWDPVLQAANRARFDLERQARVTAQVVA
jgi:CoA-dependent NAD(P)H sulfur oxidoreductase